VRAYRSRWARGAAALALVLGLAATGTVAVAQEAAGPDADDYQAAAALVEGNLLALLRNAEVTPHWLAADLGTPGFWYGRDGDSGPELVVFDLETRSRRPAFDHARMAASIFKALADADGLPGEREGSLEGLQGLSLSDDLTTLTARHYLHQVTCSVADFRCEAAPITPPEPGLLPSPDGARAAFARDDNLFVRDLTFGSETRLTHDGKPWFSYGKWPDSSLLTVVSRKTGLRQPPYLSSWSPDSRYLLAPRVDERLLETVPFVEWVPTDGSRRPVVHLLREPIAGDEDEMGVDWFLFDSEKGGRVRVEFDGASLPEEMDTPALGGGVIGWDLERNRLYMLGSAYAGKSAALVAVDVESGKATPVVWETNETRVEANTHMYNRPDVRLVRGPNDERRVLWYSDRTGWGHLYLYELAGDDSADLVGTVTAGDWTVLDIIHVDEAGRQVYFTGGGREPGDPYLRHLYRASFDPAELRGGEVTLLTANEADHHFEPAPVPMMQVLFGLAPPPPRIRPDLGVFLDTYSTVDRPPVTVLRSTEDGKVLAEVEKADASVLFEAGFVAPERRAFVAADGETEVYSVYFAPRREVEGGRHPVIDAVYGGPQVAGRHLRLVLGRDVHRPGHPQPGGLLRRGRLRRRRLRLRRYLPGLRGVHRPCRVLRRRQDPDPARRGAEELGTARHHRDGREPRGAAPDRLRRHGRERAAGPGLPPRRRADQGEQALRPALPSEPQPRRRRRAVRPAPHMGLLRRAPARHRAAARRDLRGQAGGYRFLTGRPDAQDSREVNSRQERSIDE